MVVTRVARPMSRLFWKKVAKLRSFHTFSKCSVVIGHGTSEVEPAGRTAKSRTQ